MPLASLVDELGNIRNVSLSEHTSSTYVKLSSFAPRQTRLPQLNVP